MERQRSVEVKKDKVLSGRDVGLDSGSASYSQCNLLATSLLRAGFLFCKMGIKRDHNSWSPFGENDVFTVGTTVPARGTWLGVRSPPFLRGAAKLSVCL